MNASVSLDDMGRPREVLLEALLGEWTRFRDVATADLAARGVSRWPTAGKTELSPAIDSLVLIGDAAAGALTVSIDGRELVARGDSRSLSTFLDNVHFLASPDLFPGSLSDHLHVEHIDAPDSPISSSSLPLTLHRLGAGD